MYQRITDYSDLQVWYEIEPYSMEVNSDDGYFLLDNLESSLPWVLSTMKVKNDGLDEMHIAIEGKCDSFRVNVGVGNFEICFKTQDGEIIEIRKPSTIDILLLRHRAEINEEAKQEMIELLNIELEKLNEFDFETFLSENSLELAETFNLMYSKISEKLDGNVLDKHYRLIAEGILNIFDPDELYNHKDETLQGMLIGYVEN